MEFDTNCPKTSKNTDSKPSGLQKDSLQAPRALWQDAKQAAEQPAWCQDVKISSRARPSGTTGWFPLGWGDSPK